jgi:small subunit ribosomal protein S4e
MANRKEGIYSGKDSLPLNIVLRDMLHFTATKKDSKKVLMEKNVLVDGIRRKELKFPVGLFDLIEFKDINKTYRVVIDNKDKFALIEVDKNESNIKPCKIINKTVKKGKIQLNLNDGKNIISEKDVYKTGDTVFLELPKLTIKKHVSLKKNVLVYIIGGTHISKTGKIKDIIGNRIMYVMENGDTVETLKKNVFVIGETEPVIKISKQD